MHTIKGNYVLVRIGYISVKNQLSFTKADNDNQYLTDLNDFSF